MFRRLMIFRDPTNVKVEDDPPTARYDDFTDFGMVRIPLSLGVHSPRPPYEEMVRFLQDGYHPAYIMLNGIGKSIKYFSFRSYGVLSRVRSEFEFGPSEILFLHTVLSCFLGCFNLFSDPF